MSYKTMTLKEAADQRAKVLGEALDKIDACFGGKKLTGNDMPTCKICHGAETRESTRLWQAQDLAWTKQALETRR